MASTTTKASKILTDTLIHSVLDIYKRNATESSHIIRLRVTDRFTASLLLSVANNHKESLNGYNLTLENSDETIVLKAKGKPISLDQINEIHAKVSSSITSNKDKYRYAHVADKIIKAAAKFFKTNCPYLEASAMDAIKVVPNEPCGAPDMIPYETHWCAWPHYSCVSMPNVDTLTQPHLEYMRKKLWGKGQLDWDLFYRNFFFQCCRVPCHEVIHILQHIGKQVSNTAQAEHDASYAVLPLLHAIHKDPTLEEVFIPGIYEAIAWNLADKSRSIWESWNTEERGFYEKWRDSFGTTSVDIWSSDTPESKDKGLRYESQFKLVVALEAYLPNSESKVPSKESASAMLDAMFNNRSGKILENKFKVPSFLKIDKNQIEVVTNGLLFSKA